MKKMTALGAAAAALSVSGCATLVRGAHTDYRITSAPPDAHVELSTGAACSTPCKIKLRRKDPFTATISKSGFTSVSVPVKSKVGAGGALAAAGNVLAGGIVGGIVDGSRGSLNSFKPGKLHVILHPRDEKEPSASAAEPLP